MSQITVYTKPACEACKATFRTLNKAGISYQVVDISETPLPATTS
jgi:glutaredoxin-like protein NrdH